MKIKLGKIIADELGILSQVKDVVKLHGDASYRTYYRAILDDGRSFIVMQMPEGKSSASEEITNFKGAQDELPFINIDRYLKYCGIAVPGIYRYSPTDRLMIIEDLGDDLMAKELESSPRSDWIRIYGRSVELLTKLQKTTGEKKDDSCIAFKRTFDTTLLNWEFDHFREYGIEERLGIKLPAEDLSNFESITRAISDEIESFEYVFTHRDFQSRNMILRGNDLYLIDFQDALMGPGTYDLVALLRDSYIKLDDSEVDFLVGDFASRMGIDRERVDHEFSLVTVQRKLKDAGRFVYIDRVKGNPNYLKFIPTSLGYVKAALKKLGTYGELLDLLSRYVPEYADV